MLDLIKRKDAEIARLKKAYSVYEETTGLKQAKFEAYKEFAERLKEQAYINNYCDLVVNEESIDNLLKELTEGTDAKESN